MKLSIILSLVLCALIIGTAFKAEVKTQTIAVTTNDNYAAASAINKMCNQGWRLEQTIVQPISTSINEHNSQMGGASFRDGKSNIILIFKR